MMQYRAGSQQQLHVWQGFLKGKFFFRTSRGSDPMASVSWMPFLYFERPKEAANLPIN